MQTVRPSASRALIQEMVLRDAAHFANRFGFIWSLLILCVAYAISPFGDFVPCQRLISGSCVHASQKGANHVFSVTLGNVTVPDWSCDSAVLVCHQMDANAAIRL